MRKAILFVLAVSALVGVASALFSKPVLSKLPKPESRGVSGPANGGGGR
jgi:hypothetical protein